MVRTANDVTEAELDILRILWELGFATIREVVDRLYDEPTRNNYQTTKKLVSRLEGKKLVGRTKSTLSPQTPPEHQIILDLLADGSVKFSGQKVDKIELLTGLLNREISAAQRENVSPSEIAVIIRSPQDTPYELVQELITKCQSLKLENFSVRVK